MMKESLVDSSSEYVSEADVRSIAAYVRIAMTDEEITAMTKDINATIAGFGPIREYDLAGVEPTFLPIGSLSNVMREDVECPGLTQEEALGIAPAKQDGCYLIPSILGSDDSAAAESEA